MLCLRIFGQSRHTEHIARNGHNHLTATIQDDVTNADGKALGRAISLGVGRERELRLGDADGVMGDGAVLISKGETQILQFLLRRLTILHCSSTIDALAHFLNLVFQTVCLLVGKTDR